LVHFNAGGRGKGGGVKLAIQFFRVKYIAITFSSIAEMSKRIPSKIDRKIFSEKDEELKR